MNKFDNMSAGQLADEYGNLKAQIETLEVRAKEIYEELKSRIDDAPAVGERWTVTRSDVKGRETLDAKALAAVLGMDALKPYYKTGNPSVQLRVKPTMVFGQVAAE